MMKEPSRFEVVWRGKIEAAEFMVSIERLADGGPPWVRVYSRNHKTGSDWHHDDPIDGDYEERMSFHAGITMAIAALKGW